MLNFTVIIFTQRKVTKGGIAVTLKPLFNGLRKRLANMAINFAGWCAILKHGLITTLRMDYYRVV